MYVCVSIYIPDTIIDTKGKQKSLEAWNLLNPCEWSMDATQSFEEWYLASTWWWWWWWWRTWISSWLRWQRTSVINRSINPWRWRWWLCPSRHPLQLVIRDFIWWNRIRGKTKMELPMQRLCLCYWYEMIEAAHWSKWKKANKLCRPLLLVIHGMLLDMPFYRRGCWCMKPSNYLQDPEWRNCQQSSVRTCLVFFCELHVR